MLTIFEYVCNIISHAVAGDEEMYQEIITVLEDDKTEHMERAKRLMGKV